MIGGTLLQVRRPHFHIFPHIRVWFSKIYRPGVAFAWTSPDTFEMYSTTHTYRQSANYLRISLSRDGMKHSETGKSAWTSEVTSDLSHFRVEHDLRDDPFARVWGMASSPLNDYVCISYSLHPSNMLEYVIPAEQRCFLRITSTNKSPSEFRMPLVMSSALSSGGFLTKSLLTLAHATKQILGVSTEVSALGLRLWMKGEDAENVDELAKTILSNTIGSQDVDRFIRSEKEKYSYHNELL